LWSDKSKIEAKVPFRFGDYSLDAGRRELMQGGDLVAVEPQVFDLLVYLVQNRDRVVSKDDLLEAVWGGRIVSESTLTTRINAARRAIGDSGAQQEAIRTVTRKGFRFVAPVTEVNGPVPEPTVAERRQPSALRQEIHFCTATDGTRIAYAGVGDGPPLVKAANWLNHLEYDWESPIWKHFFTAMAADRRLIRYDARGNGLSDWDVRDFSFEAFVGDLECVIEASGVERLSLLGISQGCAVSIAYAVRHPERVTHLVLYGGYSRGWCKQGSPEIERQMEALETLMRQGWGRRNPAFRQLFTTAFMPDATAEQMQWFNELQRKTASPDNAANLLRSVTAFDVDDLLARVQVPTLVLHCRGDSVQPFEEGRRLAAGIPGARFVALEGRNHLMLEDDSSWPRFLDEMRAFLGTDGRPSPTARD
jgi:DNA-binding winged helix-turn-helix (wHTH) protein/alpha-beta hydrolase superfamily lysophospholipase